ncbi:hypothetical protein TNCV_2005711 [Trichonephila clavipes]|nr:hypothetical protein TNCV_2005711 [Trichonephila clavipes]
MRQRLSVAMRILVAQLGGFKHEYERRTAIPNESDFDRRYLGQRMPLRRNRRQRIGRHLGRSGDMVVARCWQQWITKGRVYRRGGSGRPPGTQMIARIVQSEEWPLRHQQRRPSIDSTPLLPDIQCHQRNHKERLTEVGLRSRRPLRRKPLTTS